jgi:hypothetical protein
MGSRFEGKMELPGLALQFPDLCHDVLLHREALALPKSSSFWVLFLDDQSSGHGAFSLHPFPQVLPDNRSCSRTSGIRPKEKQSYVPLVWQRKSSQQLHSAD